MFNVGKILENKQMVHIVSELIILIGVVFYFSNKNKAILNQLEELNQRIEEQEQKMDKQEQVLRSLVLQVKSLTQPQVQPQVQPQPQVQVQPQLCNNEKNEMNSNTMTVEISEIVNNLEPIPMVCNGSVCKITELEDDLDSVDLDNELKEELEELK